MGAAANVLVSVYEECADSRGRRRAVIVEVAPTGRTWAIANLHYEQFHTTCSTCCAMNWQAADEAETRVLAWLHARIRSARTARQLAGSA